MARKSPKDWSPRRLSNRQILDTANERWPERYLEMYYDEEGKLKKGSGDPLAEWVVNAISDSIDEENEDRKILDLAITRLESGKSDLEGAIRGLEELRRQAGR